jgi:Tfp pilus assembly protein PilX
MPMKNRRSESGFAMVLTLLILVFLTLVVLAGFNSSILEMGIARNDRSVSSATYSAATCARLKSKELLAGNGAALPSYSLTTGVSCRTDTPKLALFVPNLAYTQIGVPGGFTITHMRFNSSGTAGPIAAVTARGVMQSLTQIVKQK